MPYRSLDPGQRGPDSIHPVDAFDSPRSVPSPWPRHLTIWPAPHRSRVRWRRDAVKQRREPQTEKSTRYARNCG